MNSFELIPSLVIFIAARHNIKKIAISNREKLKMKDLKDLLGATPLPTLVPEPLNSIFPQLNLLTPDAPPCDNLHAETLWPEVARLLQINDVSMYVIRKTH